MELIRVCESGSSGLFRFRSELADRDVLLVSS